MTEQSNCCMLRITLLNKKANTIEELDFEISLIEYFKLHELKMINIGTFKIESIYFEVLESIFNTKISIHLKEYEIYFASIITILSQEQLQSSLLKYTLNYYNDDQKTSIEQAEFLLFSKKYSEHYYKGNKLYTIDDYRKEIQLEMESKKKLPLLHEEDTLIKTTSIRNQFNIKCLTYYKQYISGKDKYKKKNKYCLFYIHPFRKCLKSDCKFIHKYPNSLITQ